MGEPIDATDLAVGTRIRKDEKDWFWAHVNDEWCPVRHMGQVIGLDRQGENEFLVTEVHPDRRRPRPKPCEGCGATCFENNTPPRWIRMEAGGGTEPYRFYFCGRCELNAVGVGGVAAKDKNQWP